MADRGKVENAKAVINPLLSGAGVTFPFEQFQGASLLVPVPRVPTPVLLEDEGEVDTFVGQESSTLKPEQQPTPADRSGTQKYTGLFSSFFGTGSSQEAQTPVEKPPGGQSSVSSTPRSFSPFVHVPSVTSYSPALFVPEEKTAGVDQSIPPPPVSLPPPPTSQYVPLQGNIYRQQAKVSKTPSIQAPVQHFIPVEPQRPATADALKPSIPSQETAGSTSSSNDSIVADLQSRFTATALDTNPAPINVSGPKLALWEPHNSSNHGDNNSFFDNSGLNYSQSDPHESFGAIGEPVHHFESNAEESAGKLQYLQDQDAAQHPATVENKVIYGIPWQGLGQLGTEEPFEAVKAEREQNSPASEEKVFYDYDQGEEHQGHSKAEEDFYRQPNVCTHFDENLKESPLKPKEIQSEPEKGSIPSVPLFVPPKTNVIPAASPPTAAGKYRRGIGRRPVYAPVPGLTSDQPQSSFGHLPVQSSTPPQFFTPPSQNQSEHFTPSPAPEAGQLASSPQFFTLPPAPTSNVFPIPSVTHPQIFSPFNASEERKPNDGSISSFFTPNPPTQESIKQSDAEVKPFNEESPPGPNRNPTPIKNIFSQVQSNQPPPTTNIFSNQFEVQSGQSSTSSQPAPAKNIFTNQFEIQSVSATASNQTSPINPSHILPQAVSPHQQTASIPVQSFAPPNTFSYFSAPNKTPSDVPTPASLFTPQPTTSFSAPSAVFTTNPADFFNAPPEPQGKTNLFESAMPTSPPNTETLNTVDLSSSPQPARTPSPSIVPQRLLNLGQSGIIYRPPYFHWFWNNNVKDKESWTPFSMTDSIELEEVFNSGNLTLNTTVATDGGRYDVALVARRREAVYWNEPPRDVRRCSWFHRTSTDTKLQPYDENTAFILEEEYKAAVTSAEWHRRVELPDNEYVVIYGPSSIAHFVPSIPTPDSWEAASDGGQSQKRPWVVKRGVDEFEIEDGESPVVDHVLFIVHGIGSVCDLKLRTVEEAVDDFRQLSQQLVRTHYQSSVERGEVNRVEVLPVSWHQSLHEETGVDEKLKKITLKSIPKLRHFTHDTLLDILFYTSPVYCQKIMNQVGQELNRLYGLFKKRNPSFQGNVSVAGHSLGSLILFDLLSHQKRPSALTQENFGDEEKRVLTRTGSYTLGTAGTGQPCITYPQLNFQPNSFYAMGSPIGMFVTVRGIDSLGLDFRLPTCPGIFNIFHPFDPVAYRLEALINPDLASVRPVLIPHHKGRKRMHLELRETMARVGADLKQKVIDTVRTTWNAVYQLTSFARSDEAIRQEVDEAFAMASRVRTESTSEDEQGVVGAANGLNVGVANQGRRLDYVLQEAPLESFNEYVSAITSHVCYWDSDDTVLFILKDIYNNMGINADSLVSIASVAEETISPAIPITPPSAPNPSSFFAPQMMSIDPTAPMSQAAPLQPPPMSGFVKK